MLRIHKLNTFSKNAKILWLPSFCWYNSDISDILLHIYMTPIQRIRLTILWLQKKLVKDIRLNYSVVLVEAVTERNANKNIV